ncbi:MAG: YifB family Mg chelatase-like AAA ATPase [Solirubrobacterales bacterium]
MIGRTHTFTAEGLEMRLVTVEVDVRPGLPAFRVVGLGDAGVREARERVRSAIVNSGYTFPNQRITANLAPGDVPKVGPAFDLALACGVLAASGQLCSDRLDRVGLIGELALDGTIRATRGTLAAAQGAASAGLDTLILGAERAREATLVRDLSVAVAERLSSAVRVLEGGAGDPLPVMCLPRKAASLDTTGPDLCDVRGQHEAVRALIIAAAGAHSSLFSGLPGTGKTMLAERLPSIMPPLSSSETIDVARMRNMTDEGTLDRLRYERPFRAPHHTITTAGLIGGARKGWVGEVVLAHHGVLFLDELAEFAGPTLEALRQPLEDGRVAIVRANHSAVYPARFMLVAATNPCRCGYAGSHRPCRCSPRELARYRRRLSGPLLDRIDLFASLQSEGGRQATMDTRPLTTSARAREAVMDARERQATRLREHGITVNAQMNVRLLEEHVKLDEHAQGMLLVARQGGSLSMRGQHRALRVARTIADLAHSERVQARHVQRALLLRPPPGLTAEGQW